MAKARATSTSTCALAFVTGFSLLIRAAPAFVSRNLFTRIHGTHDTARRIATADETEDSAAVGKIMSYRPATADDVPLCHDIEAASYPPDEAASASSLRYRQERATPYFRCAISSASSGAGHGEAAVIGFVCSTRCNEFEHESMSTHVPNGTILAIHSVVVKEEHRRHGLGTAMLKDYVASIREEATLTGIEKIVLLAKDHLLGFYVNCGFSVTKPSNIVHGEDLWYELEMDVRPSTVIRSVPGAGEAWFVKTEQFCKPFPVVKPHLEAHRAWVATLRSEGYCITSGYRVDSEGRPGGGGMMFFAAKSYADAEELVKQDPLILNECVDWRLHGWIAEVGTVQLR